MLEETKKYSLALADFEKAAAIGKASASLHAGRGIALEALGRHVEADAAFRDAFALAPAGDPAHLRLRWTYGFAEMAKEQRGELRKATRVANPGCYPTGFIALVRPLVVLRNE